MAINAGKLNKKITFLKKVQVQDDFGDHPVEEKFLSRWANVKPLRGGEFYEAQKLRLELTWKITCRYFEGLTPDMVISHKGKKFEISSIVNIDDENQWYEIYATEIIKKKGSL